MRHLNSFFYFARDIKLAHTLFALPFAASAFFFGDFSAPSYQALVLLILAMFFARTYAMGMNRFVDRKIDALNPRTNQREIPAGRLTPFQSIFWITSAALGFVGASYGLSMLAGNCSFGVLFILGLYPFWKKMSWFTHWYLGICLGMAPIAVSIALTAGVTREIAALGVAVAVWTAGFDILYALQDRAFDLKFGLKSVPARFGPLAALWISRLCFATMIALLIYIGFTAEKGLFYYIGVSLIAGLLISEHVLLNDARRSGKSRWLNVAFFNMNACVSFLFFTFSTIDFIIALGRML